MDEPCIPPVVACTTSDTDDVARMLARAFADDPVIEWMFDDPARRRSRIEQAFETWVRRIYLAKQAVDLDSSREAAACWAPPDRWRLTVIHQLRLGPSMASVFGVARLPAVLSGMQRMAEAHPDEQAHWYLGFLGTDPDHRDRGLGTRVLEHGLARCDRDEVPAYLEASHPDNVPFYERFDFRVLNEIQLPDGPSLWGMWRDPQPRRG